MKDLYPYQKTAINECWDALILNDQPVLLMASVGAGKSLMLADILLRMQKLGKKSLCLVNNAELVRNNHATFSEQGGNASVYCAALSSKDTSESVIFGTPKTILNGINKSEKIAHIKFNIILVDEAHTIDYLNDRSVFMRILRYFKLAYPNMRVLGATGTNFRFKGYGIVGDLCLFKRQVGNITTEKLINDAYLVEPIFDVNKDLIIDFSNVKIKKNGNFNQKQLQEVIDKSSDLTSLICKQIIHIVESKNRFGVFIFATTKQHAFEILNHLPPEKSALILGETSQKERTSILNNARNGNIKYIVNISIISVGIDVPAYDTIAYLRPTESLVLLVQTIGRVLRLSEKTGKKDALILDFSGNIDRNSDFDDPILMKALQQKNEDQPKPIICPRCQEKNTEHARRCIGQNDQQKRCEYFFEFKKCINSECLVKNDITARHCRSCNEQLIDPNDKLNLNIKQYELKQLKVTESVYKIKHLNQSFCVNCSYICQDDQGFLKNLHEKYYLTTDKSRNFFYYKFIQKHCNNPQKWYNHLKEPSTIKNMIAMAKNPSFIIIKQYEDNYKIKDKIFIGLD